VGLSGATSWSWSWPPAADGQDQLPDAASVAAAVAESEACGPPPHTNDVLVRLGISPRQLTTTAISARVGWMASAAGCRFAHHELRTTPPLAEDLHPEVSVWTRDGLAPLWEDGVRVAPKYFSFFLEEPQAPFHPNHRVQWRAHELLHRLVGFCWHPAMTPFEAYVGARLAELLPVVHWYGFDELARRRCERHRGVQLFDAHCDDCEVAVVAPFGGSAAPDLEQLERDAAAALEHLDTELAACRAEIDDGRVHATPRPRLDASSDAEGYLRAHWGRLTAWSFGAWVERFCIAGVDHHAGPGQLADHLVRVASRMLSGSITVDAMVADRNAARRVARDLGYRALLTLEAVDDPRLEAQVMPAIDGLGALVMSDDDDLTSRIRAGIDELLARCVGAPQLQSVLESVGYDWGPLRAASASALAMVGEGLASGLPDWADRIEPARLDGVVRALVDAPEFWSSGELRVRAHAWLDGPGRVESWLRRRPHRDSEAELFGIVPPDDGPLRLDRIRPNLTLALASASGADVHAALGWPVADADRVDLVRLWFRGTPRAFEAGPELLALLEALARNQAVEDDDVLREALNLGLLTYLPPVSG